MPVKSLRYGLLAIGFAAVVALARASEPVPAAPVPDAAPVAPAQAPAAPTPNDAWKTATELPKVDFTGMSADQKDAALAVMRSENCQCNCGMKIAECRVKDPNCPISPGLADTVVKFAKEGKKADEIKIALAAVRQIGRAHV